MSFNAKKFEEFMWQFEPGRTVNRNVYTKPTPPKPKWETEREWERSEDKEFVPTGELLSDIQSGVLDSINKKYRHTRWDMIDARFERYTVEQLKSVLQEIVDDYENDVKRWIEFCDTMCSFGADLDTFKDTVQKRHRRNMRNLEDFALYLVSAKHNKFKGVCWEDFQKKRHKMQIEHEVVINFIPIEITLGRTEIDRLIDEMDS